MSDNARIKIESDVPCDFSETGFHKVTMIFISEEDGLHLKYLSSECEESEGAIGEYLSEDTQCCGMLVDDVRLSARGEEARRRNPILRRALSEIRATSSEVHKMRKKRAMEEPRRSRLERECKELLPPKVFLQIERCPDKGTPHHARLVAGHRGYSNDLVLADYQGKGLWRMSEEFDRITSDYGQHEDYVMRIDTSWGRMENVHCRVCDKDIKPSSRKYHLESERHLNKLRDKIYETMDYVSARLCREDT